MLNKKIAYITGFPITAVTIIAYLLLCRSIFTLPRCWVALTFIVASELLATFVFANAAGNPRKVGGAIICFIEAVFCLAISVIFINNIFFSFTWYIILNLILLTLAGVFVGVLGVFDGHAAAEHNAIADAKMSMVRCRAVVNSLVNSESAAQYKQELKSLDEALRFCDDGTVTASDEAILEKINDLSHNISSEGYDVSASVNEIKDALKQRDFILKQQRSYR